MPCVGGTLSVHTLVFGLVLSLASAESPVWAYLTADCREHRVFFLLPYIHTMFGFCWCTTCTEDKTYQPHQKHY